MGDGVYHTGGIGQQNNAFVNLADGISAQDDRPAALVAIHGVSIAYKPMKRYRRPQHAFAGDAGQTFATTRRHSGSADEAGHGAALDACR